MTYTLLDYYHRLCRALNVTNLWWLYALLISILPILLYYWHNQRELGLAWVILPTLGALLLTVILMAGAQRVYRSWDATALVIGWWWLIFYSYGPIRQVVGVHVWQIGPRTVGEDTVLFGMGLLLGLSGSLLIYRYRQSFSSWSKLLMVGCVGLLVVNGGLSLYHSLHRVSAVTVSSKTELPQQEAASRPNVYYIVPDRYAAESTLVELYDYQGLDLYQQLREQGFYIFDQAQVNYPKTILSLSTTLNMDYLPAISGESSEVTDYADYFELIQNSQVMRTFKSLGYQTINIGSRWDATREIRTADINVNASWQGTLVNEALTKFLATTAAQPVLAKFLPVSDGQRHTQTTLSQFSALKQIASTPSSTPKLVFMHTLMPHDPYAFDRDCQPVPDSTLSSRTTVKEYMAQLECTNRMILETVSVIRQSDPAAVIGIQADEGPPTHLYPPKVSWDPGAYSEGAIAERTRAISAIFIPDQHYEDLYPSMSPVNTFRYFLSHQLDQPLELLPDQHYFATEMHNGVLPVYRLDD